MTKHRNSIAAIALCLLLSALCACAPVAAQTEPAAATAEATAPTAAQDGAAGEAASEAREALTAILTDISENYHPGTAGCSLTSARLAGQLLDWYDAFRPAAEDIAAGMKDFLAGMDGVSAATFVAEQLPGVYASVSEVLGETGKDLLESAGYTPTSFPWSAEDAKAAFSALFDGLGLSLPAL